MIWENIVIDLLEAYMIVMITLSLLALIWISKSKTTEIWNEHITTQKAM